MLLLPRTGISHAQVTSLLLATGIHFDSSVNLRPSLSLKLKSYTPSAIAWKLQIRPTSKEWCQTTLSMSPAWLEAHTSLTAATQTSKNTFCSTPGQHFGKSAHLTVLLQLLIRSGKMRWYLQRKSCTGGSRKEMRSFMNALIRWHSQGLVNLDENTTAVTVFFSKYVKDVYQRWCYACSPIRYHELRGQVPLEF